MFSELGSWPDGSREAGNRVLTIIVPIAKHHGAELYEPPNRSREVRLGFPQSNSAKDVPLVVMASRRGGTVRLKVRVGSESGRATPTA
jgi:hypothetical protein